MEGLIVLAWLAVAVAAAAGAGAMYRAGRRAAVRAWRKVAARHHGQLDADRLAMSLTVGETAVFVDLERVTAPESGLRTRLRARHGLPGVPRFIVEPDARVLIKHKDDVALGLPGPFDELYYVRTDDRERLARLLAPLAPGLVRDTYDLRSDGEEVSLRVDGMVDDEAALETALTIVVTLATADPLGFAALRALPGARFEPGSGGRPPAVVVDVGQPVTLRFVRDPSGDIRTTAVTPLVGRSKPGVLCLSADEDEPEDLPAAVRAELRALGRATIERDASAVTLSWDGPVTDGKMLLAGARAVAALAHGDAGPYR